MHYSDSFKRLVVGLYALLAYGSASQAQDCFICDDLVILNDPGTECFLASYDASVASARKLGAATIDLTPCTGSNGDETRGSIDKPLGAVGRSKTTVVEQQMRSSYVLDLAGVECLRRLVDREARPIKRPTPFDLTKLCESQ